VADLPSDPGSTSGETGLGTASASTPSRPRWVKVFGIIAIGLVLLVVILHLTGHNLGGHTSPSSVLTCQTATTMAPYLRKLMLTVHITSSVGWVGAVASFLALAVVGLTSQDIQAVRAVYPAMELIAWFVIVPLSFASPLSGIVQSLGTTWGLFRHYWVLIKFLMTIPCTLVLLLHMQPISRLGRLAAETTLSSGDLSRPRVQLVAGCRSRLAGVARGNHAIGL
jgi:hypothetical protein